MAATAVTKAEIIKDRRSVEIREGQPLPRGAMWDGKGVNFALFSANATRVELCLFDDAGRQELQRIDLPEFTDEIWHGYVPNLEPGTVYGYRVHGPYEPEKGHRFNHNKLLLDPYARAHIGSLTWNDACFGYTIGAENADLSFDERDSAPFVPKCVVVDPTFEWRQETRRHQVPWDRTIVYELHVRGYTKLHPKVLKKQRGTFAGLSNAEVVSYIRSLGVTSVELLPVFTFVNDRHLLDKGLTDYWGYNTIGFFAPDPRYAAQPRAALQEFKEMIARFHDAGLEVILDVVYNHTSEGNEMGPTLSFKGIDNASYYRLMPDNPRYYINDTGTGNTVNLFHPRVMQMVTDSLRYWVQETEVDGFRFDLGTILAREPNGFDNKSGFSENLQPGSRAWHRQVNRRTLGLRPGRLPGRRVSAGMGGMERQIPRHDSRLLEGRGHRWRRGTSTVRLRRHLQSPRSQTLVQRKFRHRARRFHSERSRQLQRQAQRSQRRRTTKTVVRTITLGIAASKGPQTVPKSASCASARCATSCHPVTFSGHADASRR